MGSQRVRHDWATFICLLPWTERKSNQSILNECSLEGLMLNLQYLGHLMWRVNSLENILMLGKIEGRRRRGRKRMRWLDNITNSMDVSLSKLRERVKDREAGHAAIHRVTKSWTWLNDKQQQQIYLLRTANSTVNHFPLLPRASLELGEAFKIFRWMNSENREDGCYNLFLRIFLKLITLNMILNTEKWE